MLIEPKRRRSFFFFSFLDTSEASSRPTAGWNAKVTSSLLLLFLNISNLKKISWARFFLISCAPEGKRVFLLDLCVYQIFRISFNVRKKKRGIEIRFIGWATLLARRIKNVV